MERKISYAGSPVSILALIPHFELVLGHARIPLYPLIHKPLSPEYALS